MKYLSLYLIACNLLLSACATTKTLTIQQGQTDIDELPLVVQRKGLGIFIDEQSFGLGWLNETTIKIPKGRCQVVVISRDIKEIENLLEISGGKDSLNNICLLKDSL